MSALFLKMFLFLPSLLFLASFYLPMQNAKSACVYLFVFSFFFSQILKILFFSILFITSKNCFSFIIITVASIYIYIPTCVRVYALLFYFFLSLHLVFFSIYFFITSFLSSRHFLHFSCLATFLKFSSSSGFFLCCFLSVLPVFFLFLFSVFSSVLFFFRLFLLPFFFSFLMWR